MTWTCARAGGPSAHGPGLGAGPHPPTALHFAAAELATGLGVDERPLACLHLQVCVIGQALLSLFSALTSCLMTFTGMTVSRGCDQFLRKLQKKYVTWR